VVRAYLWYLPDSLLVSEHARHLSRGRGLLLAVRGKDIPEAKRLVGRPGDHHGSVRRGGHVQHAGGVPLQLLHLGQSGVLPQAQLVLGIAVRAQDLVLEGRPLQSAHLAAGVDTVEEGSAGGIPELHGAVGSASSAGEQVALMGGPRQSLDGSIVLGEDMLGGGGGHTVPDAQSVVVGSGGQVGAIGGPGQPADLLGVLAEGGDGVVLDAHVVVDDGGVSGARGQHVAIPGEGADTGRVAVHGAHLFAGLHVPQLHGTAGSPHSDVRASLLHPGHGGNVVILAIVLHRHELSNGALLGIPEVDGLCEGHGKDVGGGPGEEVEVVVVHQLGGVQDAGGGGGDVAGGLGGGALSLLHGVEDLHGVLVAVLGSGGLVLVGEDAGAIGVVGRGGTYRHHVVSVSVSVTWSTVLVEEEVLRVVEVRTGSVGDEAIGDLFSLLGLLALPPGHHTGLDRILERDEALVISNVTGGRHGFRLLTFSFWFINLIGNKIVTECVEELEEEAKNNRFCLLFGDKKNIMFFSFKHFSNNNHEYSLSCVWERLLL
jgi:hypothetical protein